VPRTNPVTVLFLLALALAGWWAFIFGPLYLDHLEVREAAAQTIALIPGAGTPKDAAKIPVNRLNTRVGWHYQVDEETGEERVLPGLGIDFDEGVTVDYDPSTKLAVVRFSYDRVVQLKPLERRQRVHFVAESKIKLQ
jgi:hypothetical protein